MRPWLFDNEETRKYWRRIAKAHAKRKRLNDAAPELLDLLGRVLLAYNDKRLIVPESLIPHLERASTVLECITAAEKAERCCGTCRWQGKTAQECHNDGCRTTPHNAATGWKRR